MVSQSGPQASHVAKKPSLSAPAHSALALPPVPAMVPAVPVPASELPAVPDPALPPFGSPPDAVTMPSPPLLGSPPEELAPELADHYLAMKASGRL